MKSYFNYFENEFKKIANEKKAIDYKKYMRNQFEFYGFRTKEKHKINPVLNIF